MLDVVGAFVGHEIGQAVAAPLVAIDGRLSFVVTTGAGQARARSSSASATR